MGAIGIRTYLDADLAQELARAAAAQGRSESGLIADAVRASLRRGDTHVVAAAEASLARRLARIDARIDKVLREQTILRESLLLFVRVWLEHNPSLDEALADAAAISAEARFERFLDLLALTLERGGGLGSTPTQKGAPSPREPAEAAT